MTFSPVFPVAVLMLASLALVGFASWRLIVSKGRIRLDWALRIVMVLLLLVIAIRPSVSTEGQGPTASGGLEVYFVVDTTSSIVAEDYDGELPRLDGVKSDITDIIDELAGAHFSLVTFDSEAIQRVPLTTDATAVKSTVSILTPEITHYSKGSTIDEPVELLTEVLDESIAENPDRPRVLFYFGDGEQTIAGEPGSFEALAPLITGGGVLGYGTSSGGRMLEFDGYYGDDTQLLYIQDYSSSPVREARSIADEANLETAADQLGLSYTHRDAPGSISSVLSGIDVGAMTVDEGSPDSPTEFYWILAIPLGLLALRELAGMAGLMLELRRARNS